ncbi:hypothetical protein ES707_06908 [subsurface metagenome]
MDRTLKSHGSLLRARSVLTRGERIAKLMEEGKFDPEEDSPLGLPKVRLRQSKVGTKTKKAPAEEVAPEGAEAEAGMGAEAAPEGEGAPKAKDDAEAKGPTDDKGAAKGKAQKSKN